MKKQISLPAILLLVLFWCAGAAASDVTSLTLPERTVELWLGFPDREASCQLPAEVQPEGTALTWTSSDERVASVNLQGIVNAVGAGKTTITVKAGNRKATCTVTVKQAVESVTVSETSALIGKGKKKQLRADVLPEKASDKKVVWSSSDETVAVVSSNGNVSGRSAGVCFITCAAADGSGKVDSCLVTVVQQAGGIRAVYADGKNAARILMPAGDSREIYLNYLPEDTTWKETEWTVTEDVAVVTRLQNPFTAYGEPQASYETEDSGPASPVVTVIREGGEKIILQANRAGKATVTGRAADGGAGKVRIDVTVEPAVSAEGTYNADSGTQGGIPWITPFIMNTSTYRTIDQLTLEIYARDYLDDIMETIYEETVDVYILPGATKQLPRVLTSEEYVKAAAICYRIVGAHYTDGTSARTDEGATYYIALPW